MKLILTAEVAGLGAPGDIVEVKDGYGRNFLRAPRPGDHWTRGAEKQVEPIRRAREGREIRDLGPRQGGRGPAPGRRHRDGDREPRARAAGSSAP